MKQCSKCGFKNDDSMNYCGKCGIGLQEQLIEVEGKVVGESPEKEIISEGKKNNRRYIRWIGCIAIVGVIASGAIYVLKNDMKQVITYYNTGNVKLGEEVYNKLSKKQIEKVNYYFKEQIELTQTSFVNKEINQETAEEQLQKIKRISSLDEDVDRVIKEIEELNQSRVAFNKAKSYIDKQQYTHAYSNYAEVSEIDTENYTIAQTEMIQVKESAIKKALAEAKGFYQEKKYDEAISKIDNTLAIAQDDKRLIEAKSIYENEKAQEMKLVVGKDLSTETKQIKFLGADFTTRILPPDTSGAYLYYSADDDKIFLDMKFKVKNLDKYEMNLNNIFTNVALDYNNGYSYNTVRYYWTEGDDISNVYSWDTLEPLNETTYHVTVEVPRAIAKDNKSITVTLNVEQQPQILKVR